MITKSSYLLCSSYHKNIKEIDSQTVSVFGKSFQKLANRLEHKSKMMNISYSFFSIAAATHLAGGLLLSSKMMQLLFILCFIPHLFLSPFFTPPTSSSHRFGLNAEDFLEGGKLLENFLDTFKEFKSKPDDEKVNRLFVDFTKVSQDSKWLLIAKNNRLIKKRVRFF